VTSLRRHPSYRLQTTLRPKKSQQKKQRLGHPPWSKWSPFCGGWISWKGGYAPYRCAFATIAVGVDGPLYVRGDIHIKKPLGETLLEDTRVALCRCDESRNKPFCDNRHKQTHLWDKGILGDDRLMKGPTCDARRLRIIPTVNGPLLLRGEAENAGYGEGGRSKQGRGARGLRDP
jgi:hypothetical protein